MTNGIPQMWGPWGAIESKLDGWPNTWLTLLLLAVAFGTIAIAIFAPPAVKAAWAAYEVLP